MKKLFLAIFALTVGATLQAAYITQQSSTTSNLVQNITVTGGANAVTNTDGSVTITNYTTGSFTGQNASVATQLAGSTNLANLAANGVLTNIPAGLYIQFAGVKGFTAYSNNANAWLPAITSGCYAVLNGGISYTCSNSYTPNHGGPLNFVGDFENQHDFKIVGIGHPRLNLVNTNSASAATSGGLFFYGCSNFTLEGFIPVAQIMNGATNSNISGIDIQFGTNYTVRGLKPIQLENWRGNPIIFSGNDEVLLTEVGNQNGFYEDDGFVYLNVNSTNATGYYWTGCGASGVLSTGIKFKDCAFGGSQPYFMVNDAGNCSNTVFQNCWLAWWNIVNADGYGADPADSLAMNSLDPLGNLALLAPGTLQYLSNNIVAGLTNYAFNGIGANVLGAPATNQALVVLAGGLNVVSNGATVTGGLTADSGTVGALTATLALTTSGNTFLSPTGFARLFGGFQYGAAILVTNSTSLATSNCVVILDTSAGAETATLTTQLGQFYLFVLTNASPAPATLKMSSGSFLGPSVLSNQNEFALVEVTGGAGAFRRAISLDPVATAASTIAGGSSVWKNNENGDVTPTGAVANVVVSNAFHVVGGATFGNFATFNASLISGTAGSEVLFGNTADWHIGGTVYLTSGNGAPNDSAGPFWTGGANYGTATIAGGSLSPNQFLTVFSVTSQVYSTSLPLIGPGSNWVNNLGSKIDIIASSWGTSVATGGAILLYTNITTGASWSNGVAGIAESLNIVVQAVDINNGDTVKFTTNYSGVAASMTWQQPIVIKKP